LYGVLHPEKLDNKSNFTNTTEKVRDVWRMLWLLKEIWLKVGLEKLENYEGVAVKALLDSRAECNMFFKGHVERARIDMCNLGKTEVILEMPWLAAHNPEIDWEKKEVKITWYYAIQTFRQNK